MSHAWCGSTASESAPRHVSPTKSRRIDGAVETKLTLRGRKTIASASEKYAGNRTSSSMRIGHENVAFGSSSQPQHEQQQRRRRDERAAQVVEHLPAMQRREGVGVARAGRRRATRGPSHGDRLPVTADPAMKSRGGGEVVRGIVVEHFDVAGERRAQERAFDEVVREQRVLREAVLEHAREDVDLEDAFAGERALSEDVLVGVGDRTRIRVDAGRSRVHRREAAAARARAASCPRAAEPGRSPRARAAARATSAPG